MDSRLLATIIIFPIWLTLVLVFRRHRQWLFYYLFGAFGLTLQLIFMAEFFGLDQILVNVASFHVSLLSRVIFNIPMELLSNARFQMIATDGSSSILKLGIECSAVIESSILVSLIVFYPLFGWRQKVLRISFGLIVTYVINIFRIMIIVLMADKFGSDYIFVAHAGVARAFFFLFELLLYWYLLTKPTTKSVGDSVNKNIPLSVVAHSGHALRWHNTYAQAVAIVLFVGLAIASFGFSDEWHKAFIEVAHKKRPIIYQEETTLEKEKGVLGQDIEAKPIEQIEIKDLAPTQEFIYKQSFLEEAQINLQIQEGRQPIQVEVYKNGEFQNRALVSERDLRPDYQVFEKPFEVVEGDILEIRVKNISMEVSSYQLELEGYEQ